MNTLNLNTLNAIIIIKIDLIVANIIQSQIFNFRFQNTLTILSNLGSLILYFFKRKIRKNWRIIIDCYLNTHIIFIFLNLIYLFISLIFNWKLRHPNLNKRCFIIIRTFRDYCFNHCFFKIIFNEHNTFKLAIYCYGVSLWDYTSAISRNIKVSEIENSFVIFFGDIKHRFWNIIIVINLT